METHADDPPDDKQVTIPACSVVTTDGWRYNQLKQNDSDKNQDNGDLDQDDKVIHHEKIICLDNKVKHKDVKVKFIDENVKQIINSLVDLTSQGQDDKFTSDLESSTRPRENHVMYSTVTCLIVMMGLGFCGSMVGPTLPNLEILLHTDLESLGQSLMIQHFSTILGGFILLTLYDRINPELLQFFSAFLFSVATILAPWWTLEFFWAMMAVRGATGISFSFMATYPYCIALFEGRQKAQAIVIQSLTASYGVAATIGPLLTSLLLTNIDLHDTDVTHNMTSNSRHLDVNNNSSPAANIDDRPDGRIEPCMIAADFNITSNTSDIVNGTICGGSTVDVSNVRFAYVIFGFCMFFPAILLAIAGLLNKKPLFNRKSKVVTSRRESLSSESSWRRLRLIVLVLSVIYCLAYRPMWSVPGDLMASCLVHLRHWSVKAASTLTAAFWFGFLAGNLLAIPSSLVISPRTLAVSSTAIVLVSQTCMLFLPVLPEWLIWTCTLVIGVGVAPGYPAFIVWSSQYIRTTGTVTGIFMLSLAGGGTIVYSILPPLLKVASPMVVIYLAFCSTALGFLALLTLNIVTVIWSKNNR